MEKWEEIANKLFSNEFANFKNNLKGGGRRPDAVEFTNIEGDVKRRDLTINALFYDINTNEIVDLVGGIKDLKNGVVRTVGSAEDRFGEDRLRILRAIRFAGRFGSQLDPQTDSALKKDASLEGISGERIRDEFIKGIKSAKSVKHFLGLLDSYDLFDWVFKGLGVNQHFTENNDPIIVIANLLKGNNTETLSKTLNNLKYTDDEIKGVRFLIALLNLRDDTAVTLKKAQQFSGLTDDQIKTFGGIVGVSSELLDKFLRFRLTVTGPEVMEKLNIKPGPELGKAIQQIETNNFKKLK